MKEIKFRAWDAESEEMIYFPPLGVMRDIDTGSRELMLGVTEHLHGYEGINYFLTEKDAPLMQFTGLKDKNGREIYEGDVVKLYSGPDTGVVKFGGFSAGDSYEGSNFTAYGYYVEGGGGALRDDEEMTEDGFLYEVIGNIHQNPELISGEQNDRKEG